jgi:hypothetical protein
MLHRRGQFVAELDGAPTGAGQIVGYRTANFDVALDFWLGARWPNRNAG